MKSEKNLIKDILSALGVHVQNDVPEAMEDAIAILRRYGYEKWKEGYDDGDYDANQRRD